MVDRYYLKKTSKVKVNFDLALFNHYLLQN